ncbi:MAG: OmpA family protein [Saprospiraceae bacterium]|nr:OmpA family protein [Saprospiraceae bacterium]
MTYLVAFLIIFLLAVIVIQIGKVTELAAKIRGEEEVARQSTNTQAVWLMIFLVVFLVGCVASAWYYKNYMFGYGPLTSASEHGFELDYLFDMTLFFTGIVFVLTHILLFWYAYKYREQQGRKALFYAHDTKLEYIWTAIPAVVMTLLVANGLVVWNDVFPTLTDEDQYLEIEATGYQFAWDIRYPGKDGKLGNKDFRLIDLSTNSLGIDWTDERSVDDIVLAGSDKIILPKDSTIKVRITAKDVLHNFYLPHFRVKMDAVPGLPTSFIFKPVLTTEEFRQQLRNYPEWQVPADPADPQGKQRWETFEYELACAELCGIGHYSMRRIIEVVSREDYDTWMAGQKSFYATNIRNTAADPYKDKKLFDYEIKQRARELKDDISAVLKDSVGTVSRNIQLKHVFYKTGSADLSDLSAYELDNVVGLLNQYPSLKVELGGHTDNVGAEDSNLELSQKRADNVREYLLSKGIDAGRISAKGYGQNLPVESNDTDEGKQKNRRTELRILSK